jgi:hypothetical protein
MHIERSATSISPIPPDSAPGLLKRARGPGVMRAAGMTRRQLHGTIGREIGDHRLAGHVPGPAGQDVRRLAPVQARRTRDCRCSASRSRTLLTGSILAGLAGLAAAILPSLRAAKLNGLRAIITQ